MAFGAAGVWVVIPGRYIVELTGESVVEHVTRRPGASASARRTAIRSGQDDVKRRMGAPVNWD